jgi:Ca-activated chloride channel homolog
MFGSKNMDPRGRAGGKALVIILIGLLLSSCPGEMKADGQGLAVKAEDGIDVTREFAELNGPRQMKAPDGFRKGNVTRTAASPVAVKTDAGWEIQLGQTNIPSPVVYNGMVLVSGGFGGREYYAFDAAIGRILWSVSLDDDGPSSAAVADGVVVFNTESCTIFACRADSGEQIWSYWLGDPLMCMPTIANGIVFTAYPAPNGPRIESPQGPVSATHVLIAIELKTGKILWQKWIDGDVMSAPVAAGDDLFVSTFSGTLLKFRQKSGTLLSARAVRATSAPVVRENRIYMSRRADRDGEKVAETIAALDAADMQTKNEFNKKEAPYLDHAVQEKSALKSSSMQYDAANGFSGGAPESAGWQKAAASIGQSNVSSLQSFQGSRTLNVRGRNFNTMGDELIGTDEKTGAVAWKVKLSGDAAADGGFMGAPPIAAGNRIVLAHFTGDITVYEQDTGRVVGQYRVRDQIRYQPVVDNGWLYVTTANGKLAAINTGDRTLTGWPMWGANAGRTNLAD